MKFKDIFEGSTEIFIKHHPKLKLKLIKTEYR